LTEDNLLLVITDDVDFIAQVLIDEIHQAAPPARSVSIPPPTWAFSKPEIAVLTRKGRTLRCVWMRTRHTLDLARWRAAVSELRKVLRMAKSVPLKCPRNLKRQPLHRFSLKQSDGTFALSVSEIAEVFADDLEN